MASPCATLAVRCGLCSASDATINGERIRPVGQIIFDVNGEYSNTNQHDKGRAVSERYTHDVIRYGVLEKPGFTVLAPNIYRSIAEIIDLLRAGKIVIIDLSQCSPGIQKKHADCISEVIYADATNHFMHRRQANFIQMYFDEAHHLFQCTEDLTQIYNRLAREGRKLRIGLCYATPEARAISRIILDNTYIWVTFRRGNRN